MSQFVGDYIKAEFRSLHHDEPLKPDDVDWLVRNVKKKFPDATREEIIRAAPFKIAEKKSFRFYNEMEVEAYNRREAENEFADTSIDFAANAEVEEVTDPVETTFIKEIRVKDPDTGGSVPIEIHKDNESGGIFGIDSAFVDQIQEVINSPFNNSKIKLQDP